MTREEMHKYWQTEEWAKIKCDLIAEYGFVCQWCGKKTESLAVHHLTYENLGYEEPGDLVLICNECHAKEHGKIPRKAKKTRPVKASLKHKPHKKVSNKQVMQQCRRALSDKFIVTLDNCKGWAALADKTAKLHGERWRGKSRAKKYVVKKLLENKEDLYIC